MQKEAVTTHTQQNIFHDMRYTLRHKFTLVVQFACSKCWPCVYKNLLDQQQPVTKCGVVRACERGVCVCWCVCVWVCVLVCVCVYMISRLIQYLKYTWGVERKNELKFKIQRILINRKNNIAFKNFNKELQWVHLHLDFNYFIYL